MRDGLRAPSGLHGDGNGRHFTASTRESLRNREHHDRTLVLEGVSAVVDARNAERLGVRYAQRRTDSKPELVAYQRLAGPRKAAVKQNEPVPDELVRI